MSELDFERCARATKNIFAEGLCDTQEREDVIEKAIAAIQDSPTGAFSSKYIGVKRYAHFGDQFVECEYGMGPRHGSVVFRVGRAGRRQGVLGDDEIYFLESCRDFTGLDLGDGKGLRSLSSLVSLVEASRAKLFLAGSVFADVGVVTAGALAGSLGELIDCGFECEAGPLTNHTAFQSLVSASARETA